MYELILVKKKYNTDGVGNQVEQKDQEVKTSVLCRKKDITRAEFYLAKTAGFKPTLELEVNRYDYNNETEVKFDEKTYKVLRAYSPEESEYIELICEEV